MTTNPMPPVIPPEEPPGETEQGSDSAEADRRASMGEKTDDTTDEQVDDSAEADRKATGGDEEYLPRA